MAKEYVYFEVAEEKPRTNVYNVISKSEGIVLGIIYWHAPWRQYIFEAYAGMLWSRGCLKQVINFIQKLMDERKK